MATGRMLKKEISDSRKLGIVKTDRARVLYFMMLPHLDAAGRLEADVRRIRGQITTMLPYSERAIQSCLEQLHAANLVVLYTGSDKQYLEYTRFGDFQSLNPDREAKTKIPDPTPNNSGVIQSSPPKLSKDKLSKDKLSISISKDKGGVVFPDNLKTSTEFRAAWIDWEQYRKESRKKLTPTSIKRQLKMLSENSGQAVEIIETSIRNSWTGLFPINGANNGRKTISGSKQAGQRQYVDTDKAERLAKGTFIR